LTALRCFQAVAVEREVNKTAFDELATIDQQDTRFLARTLLGENCVGSLSVLTETCATHL